MMNSEVSVLNEPPRKSPLSLAAFCSANFDRVLSRIGAKPSAIVVRQAGEVVGSYRKVFFALPQGRHAAIALQEGQAEFEISLERVGWQFHQSELDALMRFLGVEESEVEKYCNPPIRWLSSPSTTPSH